MPSFKQAMPPTMEAMPSFIKTLLSFIDAMPSFKEAIPPIMEAMPSFIMPSFKEAIPPNMEAMPSSMEAVLTWKGAELHSSQEHAGQDRHFPSTNWTESLWPIVWYSSVLCGTELAYGATPYAVSGADLGNGTAVRYWSR
eukprot:2332558-Rhodomonas_salina.1